MLGTLWNKFEKSVAVRMGDVKTAKGKVSIEDIPLYV
jgi:hypothetical protein